ncbi:MAG: hypothetical protein LBN21_00900 [Treponema sp.]|jgi:hypothetical protein|nr:hypothetical protein [Treponema sp.]
MACGADKDLFLCLRRETGMQKKVPAFVLTAALAVLVLGCGSVPPPINETEEEAPIGSTDQAGVQPPDRVPTWFTNTRSLYPDSKFIWVKGEAATPENAKEKALIEMSRYFHTTVEAVSEEISEYRETISSTKNEYSDKTQFNEYSRIESQEDFFGIRFTDPWLNPKNKAYTVLAYINRKDAEEQYRLRVETNMVGINALMAAVTQNDDPLYSLKLLAKEKSIADMTRKFIDNLSFTSPGKSRDYLQKYALYLNTIQQLYSEYERLRSRTTFSISVRGDAGGRVKRAVQKVFEQNKLIVAPNSGEYAVTVQVNAPVKKAPYGEAIAYSIKGGIEIAITRKGDAVFPSYTQSYEEYKKLERKVVSDLFYKNVEVDLEKNFRAHVVAMLES